ncbi:MAG: hypothetical protein H6648_09650 [Caldilineae bacterium]|nr:hypothetical protein [Chloroflexota bacterium]MCB9177412.1 hypothetical protein [Caldilineae bacterium]
MIHIEPERASLHGQFSAELPPVAVIDSGDRVRFRTLDVAWGMGQHPLEGSWRPKFEPRLAGRRLLGHARLRRGPAQGRGPGDRGMLDRVQRRHGLARSAALALIGVAADLRVSQMVNGRLGVHLVLPDAAIEPAPA